MGFFKFLKRDKKDEFDFDLNLDMPPLPPEFKDDMQLPELPELPNLDAPEGLIAEQNKNIPNKDITDKDIMRDIGLSEQLIEPKIGNLQNIKSPHERILRMPQKEIMPRHNELKHHEKSIFLKVDRFRDVLMNISSIKDSLKNVDNSIKRLNEINSNRDNAFEKLHAALADSHKKLIFVDKTMFKG